MIVIDHAYEHRRSFPARRHGILYKVTLHSAAAEIICKFAVPYRDPYLTRVARMLFRLSVVFFAIAALIGFIGKSGAVEPMDVASKAATLAIKAAMPPGTATALKAGKKVASTYSKSANGK